MIGMDRTTGMAISGIDHLRQSVEDILTTRVGSRVMRRDYGSRLPELVDAPLNRGTLLEMYAAVNDALGQWEPRFRLDQVTADPAERNPEQIRLTLKGEYLPEGRPITMEGILL